MLHQFVEPKITGPMPVRLHIRRHADAAKCTNNVTFLLHFKYHIDRAKYASV